MISGCYDDDEMRRRVLKSVHSKSDRLKVLEAMVEQNMILGDIRAAHIAARSFPSSQDTFQRASKGELIETIYGDIGTSLLSRRINAVRIWNSCGGERGKEAVSNLFKRILSLRQHRNEKAWIFHALIERMVESEQWDHAEELLESAITRGDVQNPVSYVFKKEYHTLHHTQSITRIHRFAEDNTVTLSLAGLHSSTAIVAVRREILRTRSPLMKIMFIDSKQARSGDLVLNQISELEERLTVMRATGELDSRVDWLICQVLDGVRHCRRPDNSIMITDVTHYMSGTDAMSTILRRYGSMQEFLENFPDMFRLEKRDVEILRVHYDAEPDEKNSVKENKALFSILRSVRQSRAQTRRYVLYEDVIRELKTTQSPAVIKYIKDRYQTLRVLLNCHPTYFKLYEKRNDFLLLGGEGSSRSSISKDDENEEMTSDEWYVLRTSVLGSLRSIGIERIRQATEGRVFEIGLGEIEQCREQFDLLE